MDLNSTQRFLMGGENNILEFDWLRGGYSYLEVIKPDTHTQSQPREKGQYCTLSHLVLDCPV